MTKKISVAGGRATLTNSFGEKFEYAAVNSRLEKSDGASMEFTLQALQPAAAESFQLEGSDEIVEKASAYKKKYRKFGAEFYLTNIELAAGGGISIERNADGRIAKASHDDKFIQFKWSEGEHARLLSVVDNAKRRVSFVHRDGLLKSVKTVSGGKWTYSYNNGKLVKVLNPLGRVELKVEYEGERVSRTSNEASFKRYSYSDKSTTVTTSENYEQTFEHDAKGLVRRIYDRQGVLAELEYDAAHRVKSISDGKKVSSFEYDQGGRLVRQQMPNETTRVFEYDAEGKVAAINENGVRLAYDADRGKKRAKVNPFINRANQEKLRSAARETGQSGSPTLQRPSTEMSSLKRSEEARIGSEEESSETVYDTVGRKAAEKLSDGTIIRYRYDAAGNIVRMWDAKSRELRAEYDALNSLTKVFNQHGWVRAERDRAGRIVKLENSGGQVREFAYNTDGALVKLRNAEGKEYRYFYTLRGKLRAVVNEKGRVVEYCLDENGNAVSTKRYWLDKGAKVTFGKISYRRNASQEDEKLFFKIDYRQNALSQNAPQEQAASFLKTAYWRDARPQEQEDEDDDDVVNPRDVGLSDGFSGVEALRLNPRFDYNKLPCKERVLDRCVFRRGPPRRSFQSPHGGFGRGISLSPYFGRGGATLVLSVDGKLTSKNQLARRSLGHVCIVQRQEMAPLVLVQQ